VPPFIGHGFARERDNKHYFKFYKSNAMLLIYRMILEMLIFGDECPSLGPLGYVAVLGKSVVVRKAWNTDILQFWPHSTDKHFILLHVKFEGGLSVSVLKNKATRHKNSHLEIVKFLKKSNVLNGPLYFKTRLFQTLVGVGICKMIGTSLNE
jgi:hypothetical protein